MDIGHSKKAKIRKVRKSEVGREGREVVPTAGLEVWK